MIQNLPNAEAALVTQAEDILARFQQTPFPFNDITRANDLILVFIKNVASWRNAEGGYVDLRELNNLNTVGEFYI